VNEKIADDVYRRLRRDIIRGVLRPNESLVETELAERLNVSRTPVRETLHRLAADGLIVSHRRRWHVYEHSREEIRQIYEVRAALEGYAARLACQRGSDAAITAVADAQTEPEPEPSTQGHVEQNERFHDLIVAAAGNDRLAAQIRGNRLYFFNYRIAAAYAPEDVAEYARQHAGLVAAVTDRDADRAERLTRDHIDHALNLILTKLH
jgi:DNA-binding GntR family transcriptional regulator